MVLEWCKHNFSVPWYFPCQSQYLYSPPVSFSHDQPPDLVNNSNCLISLILNLKSHFWATLQLYLLFLLLLWKTLGRGMWGIMTKMLYLPACDKGVQARTSLMVHWPGNNSRALRPLAVDFGQHQRQPRSLKGLRLSLVDNQKDVVLEARRRLLQKAQFQHPRHGRNTRYVWEPTFHPPKLSSYGGLINQ